MRIRTWMERHEHGKWRRTPVSIGVVRRIPHTAIAEVAAANTGPVHAQCRVQVWDGERREWVDYELLGPWELSEAGVDLIVDSVLV